MTRQAWMVQTDDWNEQLTGNAFWERLRGNKSSNSGGYSGRNSDRMSLGRFYGSSRENYDSGGNADGDVSGEGSEFYNGDGDTYRTVCVRSCDGYFSPVSFSTTEDRFEDDQKICQQRCGSGAKLYVYRNPGETAKEMLDLDGNAYSETKTAFLFKTTYRPACTCKAHPWQLASRDRHSKYALKAAIKGKRGQSRRLAKSKLRKFKRRSHLKQRLVRLHATAKIVDFVMTGVSVVASNEVYGPFLAPAPRTHGRARSVAVGIRDALRTEDDGRLGTQALATLAGLRTASMSPVRALPVSRVVMFPTDDLALEEATARLVTPENDDEEIFLPVRHPIRLLSRLSRPRELRDLADVISAGGRPGAGIETAASDIWVVAIDDDDGPIMLPIRNPLRRTALLASVSKSHVVLNRATSSGPGLEKQKRSRDFASVNGTSAMRLGARKSSKAVSSQRKRRDRPSVRKPRRSWRERVFESQD